MSCINKKSREENLPHMESSNGQANIDSSILKGNGVFSKTIKKGINLHTIKTTKYKTNLIGIFLTFPIIKEEATKNTLIALMLKRGSKLYKTREEITNKLAEMYGASLDSGIEKSGDNHILKFYLESINEKYLPHKEDLFKQSINLLFDVVFNPNIENNGFNEEFLKQEKNSLEQIINSKIDNKTTYALNRCIEKMYEGKPYGAYKYGYVEDLKDIDGYNLYEQYKKILSTCKIDIFVSEENDNIEDIIVQNEKIAKLNEREPNFIKFGQPSNPNNEKYVEEKMDIQQGKIVLGIDVENKEKDLVYSAQMYNAILGGTANSKLFRNVREKASLAYTISSSYMKLKSNIFIRAGIEIDKYEEALKIIKEQMEEMKQGAFSDDDIENAKRAIITNIKNIKEEQDIEISYYYGQELSDVKTSLEEYIQKIEKISRQDIIEVANCVKINTIYFLRN